MSDKPLPEMPRDSCITSRVTLIRHFLHACPATVWAIILCLILITSVRAQERVRTAQGALPIQTFRRAPETFFRLGPFDGNITASTGVEYTDNANLSETSKLSRFRFDQGLTLDVVWVVSHLSQLEIVFGGRVLEDIYGNGKNEVNFEITPSMIQYKFSIGDIRIRLYDQFSYLEDPTTDPTITNITYLRRFTNTVGAAVDADLGVAILSLSGDYTYSDARGAAVAGTTSTLASETIAADTGTRNTYRVGAKTTFAFSPTVFYGLDTSVTRSTGSHTQNINSLSIGPFIHGKLGPAIDFDLAGGGTLIDAHPSIPPGYYFSAVVRHQTTRYLQLILSAAHDLVYTTGTELFETTEFRLSGLLNLTRFITFTASPFYILGDEQTGLIQGNFNQYGFELSLGWRPRKRWSTSLSYDLYRRSSDLPSDSYVQNRIAFGISYAF
jgi:hypothetical protein